MTADRRRFLKIATRAIGAGLGIVVVAPALRLLGDTDGTTVKTPTEPIDVGSVDQFELNKPMLVTLVASEVTDAWLYARDNILGAAWVRRTGLATFEVLSSVCPHLGCAVELAGTEFVCPCHKSKFAISGAMVPGGQAKRGLDALAHRVVDGRLQITWARYALDTAEKNPA